MQVAETIILNIDGQEIKVNRFEDGTFEKPDYLTGAEREVVGTKTVTNCAAAQKDGYSRIGGKDGYNSSKAIAGEINITAPATDAARLWDGWGTALKPAWEPILLAMKPLDGTFAENALAWGIAGLNVDGARVETDEILGREQKSTYKHFKNKYYKDGYWDNTKGKGRWPANLILSDDPEVMAGFPVTGPAKAAHRGKGKGASVAFGVYGGESTVRGHNDTDGSASRYFYCAKASKSERNHGLPDGVTNKHPTVKPVSLCQYLARLTKTPTGGIVLDPFCGSGSIGVGAILEGRSFIGIDQDADSIEVARYRLDAAIEETAVSQMELEL